MNCTFRLLKTSFLDSVKCLWTLLLASATCIAAVGLLAAYLQSSITSYKEDVSSWAHLNQVVIKAEAGHTFSHDQITQFQQLQGVSEVLIGDQVAVQVTDSQGEESVFLLAQAAPTLVKDHQGKGLYVPGDSDILNDALNSFGQQVSLTLANDNHLGNPQTPVRSNILGVFSSSTAGQDGYGVLTAYADGPTVAFFLAAEAGHDRDIDAAVGSPSQFGEYQKLILWASSSDDAQAVATELREAGFSATAGAEEYAALPGGLMLLSALVGIVTLALGSVVIATALHLSHVWFDRRKKSLGVLGAAGVTHSMIRIWVISEYLFLGATLAALSYSIMLLVAGFSDQHLGTSLCNSAQVMGIVSFFLLAAFVASSICAVLRANSREELPLIGQRI